MKGGCTLGTTKGAMPAPQIKTPSNGLHQSYNAVMGRTKAQAHAPGTLSLSSHSRRATKFLWHCIVGHKNGSPRNDGNTGPLCSEAMWGGRGGFPCLAYPHLPTHRSFPLGCAHGSPGLPRFRCSVPGPHRRWRCAITAEGVCRLVLPGVPCSPFEEGEGGGGGARRHLRFGPQPVGCFGCLRTRRGGVEVPLRTVPDDSIQCFARLCCVGGVSAQHVHGAGTAPNTKLAFPRPP